MKAVFQQLGWIGKPGIICILLVFGSPFAVQANQNNRHIVILETMTIPIVQRVSSDYRHHMNLLAQQDGISLRYTILNAEGKPGRTGSLLRSLLETETPDLVLSVATLASREARQVLEYKDIPQLFLVVGDPVKEGFVSHIGQTSGSNITGHTHNLSVASRISIAAQALGQRDRPWQIGLLFSSYPSSESIARRLLLAQHDHDNIDITPMPFDYRPGAEGRPHMYKSAIQAINTVSTPIDALWVATGPASNDINFLSAIKKAGIPVLYSGSMQSVKAGALMAMLSLPEMNAATGAAITREIFAGKFAGDIPITRPDRFLLGLNISTAQALNITIPSQILELAGENVFK